MLENIVFNELARREEEIYFHKQKYECDFLIKRELKICSVIQATKTLAESPEVKQREMRGLVEAMQIYQLNEGIILTMDEEGFEEIVENRKMKIKIIPVWKWLLSTPRFP